MIFKPLINKTFNASLFLHPYSYLLYEINSVNFFNNLVHDIFKNIMSY